MKLALILTLLLFSCSHTKTRDPAPMTALEKCLDEGGGPSCQGKVEP